MIEKNKFKNLEQDLRIRNYSHKTIKLYLYYNQDFSNYADKGPRTVKEGDIKDYLEMLSRNKSSQTASLALNALKYYYRKFYKRSFFTDIKHPKKESKLPVVLSKNEARQLLKSVNNVKYKLILGLIYSAGLRVSEVVELKVKDLDFDNRALYVRSGKGKKDRQTLLSKLMMPVSQKYSQDKRAYDYLQISDHRV